MASPAESNQHIAAFAWTTRARRAGTGASGRDYGSGFCGSFGEKRPGRSSIFSGSGSVTLRSQPHERQRTTPSTGFEEGLCGSVQYGLGQFQGRSRAAMVVKVPPYILRPLETRENADRTDSILVAVLPLEHVRVRHRPPEPGNPAHAPAKGPADCSAVEPAFGTFRASGVRRHSAHRPHRLSVCGSCPALGTSALPSSNAAASASSNAVRDPASPSSGFIAFAAAARCHRTAATSTRTAGGLAPEVATRNTTQRRRGRKCGQRPERLATRGLERAAATD